MVDVPDWEHHHSTIRQLTELVDTRLALLTTSNDHPLARQLAAAYVARCRRLVLAMDVLYEAGMRDAIGGILRICFEAWLTGLWVLFTGQEAVQRLNAEYVSRMNQLIQQANLGEELDDAPENVAFPPNTADMATEVGRLLVEAGDDAGDTLRWSYDLVYRYQSAHGVHVGLASVLTHFDDQGVRWGIKSVREDASDGSAELLWGAILLGVLTRRVFVKFGIGVSDLDTLIGPIQELALELNQQVMDDRGSPFRADGSMT